MAIGSLALIQISSLGAGSSALTVNQIIKEKIKFFLQTNKFEIVANPTYGADLVHFIMRPLDSTMTRQLMQVVRVELGSVMPYVNITKLDNIAKPDQGSLFFTLHYSVNNTEDTVDIEV